MKKWLQNVACTCVILICVACATAQNSIKVASANKSTFNNVLLLPIEVTVYEINRLGEKELALDWSKIAEENLLSTELTLNLEYKTINMSELQLTPDEQQIIQSHLALNHATMTMFSRFIHTNTSGWEKKLRELNYTLGNGLAFLQKNHGIDGVKIITGTMTVLTEKSNSAENNVTVASIKTSIDKNLIATESGNYISHSHLNSDDNPSLFTLESANVLTNKLNSIGTK